MRKITLVLVTLLLVSISLADYFSFFIGFAVSGTAFPYVGIYYNSGDIKLGGSLGFTIERDEKNKGWDYVLSPSVDMEYSVFDKISVVCNVRMITVFPYQSEQLYLMGIGGKYSFPIWEGILGLRLSTDFIIPISAGEKAWNRGMKVPIPFIEAEYEFKTVSSDDL